MSSTKPFNARALRCQSCEQGSNQRYFFQSTKEKGNVPRKQENKKGKERKGKNFSKGLPNFGHREKARDTEKSQLPRRLDLLSNGSSGKIL